MTVKNEVFNVDLTADELKLIATGLRYLHTSICTDLYATKKEYSAMCEGMLPKDAFDKVAKVATELAKEEQACSTLQNTFEQLYCNSYSHNTGFNH